MFHPKPSRKALPGRRDSKSLSNGVYHPVFQQFEYSQYPGRQVNFQSGGLDKTIKLFPFDSEKQTCGESLELKMTLQCRGMKIDGATREKDKKKLHELITKATDDVLSQSY